MCSLWQIVHVLTTQIQGEGKSWASDVDKENGSYDYLMFVSLDIRSGKESQFADYDRLTVSFITQ